jgi:SAM-dependent methyltransferase
LAVIHLVEAAELRKRRRQLAALPTPAAVPGDDKPDVATVAGALVDEATLAGVAREMQINGVQVVDLVPGDLPVDRALRLLRRIEPQKMGEDPFYAPGGAHEAVAVHRSVAERMSASVAFDGPHELPLKGAAAAVDAESETAWNPQADGPDGPPDLGPEGEAQGDSGRRAMDGPLNRYRMVRHTVTAQRHAPTKMSVRVAPGLKSGPWSPEDRWQELEATTAFAWPYGSLPPILVGMETAHLLAMTAGLAIAPVGAVAALATWCAQPLLVFAGGGSGGGNGRGKDNASRLGQQPGSGGPGSLEPPGTVRASLLRLPEVWAANLRTVLAGRTATKARTEERHAHPPPRLPDHHTLFEPRRDTCAWCGSASLRPRLDVTDLLQHKPGTFHLDECDDCGHIFQNPALTIEGLDHYYEDAYEGIGEELAETSFAALEPIYRSRVETLARYAEPKAWLDVGTGHAHFVLAARRRWPDATFDGLDMSETVDEAQRRGRIDTAYKGWFPDMVEGEGLPRTYDVVTMHHYIEHTREPRRELAAAAEVLEPGGHLMIEMPDPATPWSRRLGRYWWQWGQPQHQHFVPCEEMVTALEHGGFEVVSVERGAATMGGELFNSVGLLLQSTVRSPHLPWLPPTSATHKAKRLAFYSAALPFMMATKLADELKDAVLRRSDAPGNAYRIVARRT